MQIFGEKHHAVFKEAAVYDLIVDFFQEGKLEIFVLGIFHQNSL